MDKLIFSAIIGLIAGVHDIIPMLYAETSPATPPFRRFFITFSFQLLFSM